MIIFDESDHRFLVRKSGIPGAGLGLFARTALKKGEGIEVLGVLIPRGSDTDRFTHYADRHKFRVGKFLLIPLGFAGMANHSDAPNMQKVIRGKRVYLKALRAIPKGEELFFRFAKYARTRLKARKA